MNNASVSITAWIMFVLFLFEEMLVRWVLISLKIFAGCDEASEFFRVGVLVLRLHAILTLTGTDAVRKGLHLGIDGGFITLIDDNWAEKPLVVANAAGHAVLVLLLRSCLLWLILIDYGSHWSPALGWGEDRLLLGLAQMRSEFHLTKPSRWRQLHFWIISQKQRTLIFRQVCI